MTDPKPKYPNGKNPNSLKNLKKIRKGTVLNPAGYHAQNKNKRELKNLTHDSLSELAKTVVRGKMSDLVDIIKNPDEEPLIVGIANCLLTAIKRGDWSTISAILDRILGKMPDNLNIAHSLTNKPQVIITLPDNGRILDVTPKDE